MNTVNSPSYFSQTDFSSEGFACRLANLVDLSQKKNGHRPILFLCIGSDRVPGDCLGPLVGYKLERLCDTMQHTFVVCGSLAHPVHAVNLRQKLHYVKHLGDFLTIAIDASIGAKENLGMLCLSNSALYPGEGVAKSLASPSGRNLYYRGHKLRRQSHSISPSKCPTFFRDESG